MTESLLIFHTKNEKLKEFVSSLYQHQNLIQIQNLLPTFTRSFHKKGTLLYKYNMAIVRKNGSRAEEDKKSNAPTD
uniref:Uncharacterized protein n=1 Tax=Meloidogyne enterolobii TaxID=390850 RepID=A0A6V7W471_MELEN|nr:unnamed protein product [Meloidogyne enterolobii]